MLHVAPRYSELVFRRETATFPTTDTTSKDPRGVGFFVRSRNTVYHYLLPLFFFLLFCPPFFPSSSTYLVPFLETGRGGGVRSRVSITRSIRNAANETLLSKESRRRRVEGGWMKREEKTMVNSRTVENKERKEGRGSIESRDRTAKPQRAFR